VAEFNDNGDLLDSDGRINRAILGRKVFANPEQLEKLQKITWPGTESDIVRKKYLFVNITMTFIIAFI